MRQFFKWFDWVAGCWVCQFIFFLAGIGLYFKGLHSGIHGLSIQFYMGMSILVVFLTTVNALILRGELRRFFGVVFTLVYTVMLPLSFSAFGVQLEYMIGFALLMTILMIAIVPVKLGVAVLLVSLSFACYIHWDKVLLSKVPISDKQLIELERSYASGSGNPVAEGLMKVYHVKKPMNLQTISALADVYGSVENWIYLYKANRGKVESPEQNVVPGTELIVPILPAVPKNKYALIIICYIGAAILAFCWKLLIARMYEIFFLGLSSNVKVMQARLSDFEQKLGQTTDESNLIKEKLALQIMEMNKITGYKK